MDEQLLKKATEITLSAGEQVEKWVNESVQVSSKGLSNFVTNIDINTQNYLVERLKPLIPEAGFIAEEEGGFQPKQLNWIIDPIDGTTNLIHRMPNYAISIALFNGQLPVLGIVYNPVSKELFSAVRNAGAWLNDEPIHISSTTELGDAMLALGLPYHKSKAKKVLSDCCHLIEKTGSLIRLGCASLALAHTACGRLEGLFKPGLQLWDYAAGAVILLEAGGTLSFWNGESLTYSGPADVVATNGHIHEKLLSELSPLDT